MARPREFDEEEVLEQALIVFWQKGYEGTSLMNLLEATGLTKSSLYAAFGNKESLFCRVVERYQQKYLSFRIEAFAEPTPRRIVERLLLGMVDLHINENTPLGCLEVNSAIACSAEGEAIRELLVANRAITREALRDRFEEVAGKLPKGMTSDQAAFFIATLIQGMAIQAKSGACRQDLLDLVNSVLLAWP
ncbi:TetR/AcrR family transcriptional regulator [Pseudomonas akapageensis]|uniref:TetR/AcrR family transcriptional regulator n=1 Tax=Pseudomonas akapageensis TaxID=2609961 RepID=UPI00140A7FC7|nr:TetR/AcrR family transcriptional regulator [Pseudomonas akapageensis]